MTVTTLPVPSSFALLLKSKIIAVVLPFDGFIIFQTKKRIRDKLTVAPGFIPFSGEYAVCANRFSGLIALL